MQTCWNDSKSGAKIVLRALENSSHKVFHHVLNPTPAVE